MGERGKQEQGWGTRASVGNKSKGRVAYFEKVNRCGPNQSDADQKQQSQKNNFEQTPFEKQSHTGQSSIIKSLWSVKNLISLSLSLSLHRVPLPSARSNSTSLVFHASSI